MEVYLWASVGFMILIAASMKERFWNLGGVDELFYLRNLQNRKLYLTEDIDEYVIDSVVRHILQYNADDKGKPVEDRKPILLYCSSNGGSIDPGFELVDVILQSKTPV